MTAEKLFTLIYVAELSLSVVPAVMSVVVYATRNRWWRHSIGIHLMGYMSVVAVVLALSLLRWAIGVPPWLAWTYLGVFALVPVITWWRLIVILQTDDRVPERSHLRAIDTPSDRSTGEG